MHICVYSTIHFPIYNFGYHCCKYILMTIFNANLRIFLAFPELNLSFLIEITETIQPVIKRPTPSLLHNSDDERPDIPPRPIRPQTSQGINQQGKFIDYIIKWSIYTL